MPGSDSQKQLHVILDIDETLLFYVKEVDKNPKHIANGTARDWSNFGFKQEYTAQHDSEKAKAAAAGKQYSGFFALRPKVKEFIKALFDEGYSVSIWTWSDEGYAHGVAEMVSDREFDNIWSEYDADAAKDYGDHHNKNLNWIWYEKKIPGFYPCNTVLVDELKENTKNPSNFRNSIQLSEFLGDPNDDELMSSVLPKLKELAKKVKSRCEEDSSEGLVYKNDVKFKDLYGARRSTRRKRPSNRRNIKKTFRKFRVTRRHF